MTFRLWSLSIRPDIWNSIVASKNKNRLCQATAARSVQKDIWIMMACCT